MTHYYCSGLILYTSDNRILLEDRRQISKHGEHWSFFGGSLKDGETKGQALIREIKEELDYSLEAFSYFGEYDYQPIEDLIVTYYMFKALYPKDAVLKPHRGTGMKLFTYKQAMRLKTLPVDKLIIQHFFQALPQL